ncbi:hypothetical protein SMH99_18120 [Spiroplasma poulsonii]|nr:hypothetical protein SMH99_18120 [Spiroplasma poulsonii]
MNLLMLKKETLNVRDFNNLWEEWNLIKNFGFINKLKAAKQISKLRGQTIATIFKIPWHHWIHYYPLDFKFQKYYENIVSFLVQQQKKWQLNY